MIDKSINDLKILISESEIQKRIKELAHEIDSKFSPDETIYVICVLKGAVMFFSELSKHIKHNIKMEFIRISSYGDESKTSNSIKNIDFTLPDLTEENVLIVEDIVDSGLSGKFLKEKIKEKYKVKKLMFISLLNKQVARKTDIEPDLYGFNVDDKFLVGFGLDYKGFFRNLPFIGYF